MFHWALCISRECDGQSDWAWQKRLDHSVMADQSPQVITLSLTSPEEMFVLAPADLFSEYRNFMTGLEYCISLLRSRRASGPVRIELALPADRITDGTDERIRHTLTRYCEHESRTTYENVERYDLTDCSRSGSDSP